MAKKQAIQVDSSGAHIVDLADAAVQSAEFNTGIGVFVSYELGAVLNSPFIHVAPAAISTHSTGSCVTIAAGSFSECPTVI